MRKSRTKRPLAIRIIIGSAIAFTILFFLEIILRVVGVAPAGDMDITFAPFLLDQRANRELYVSDPRLFWKLRPGDDTFVNRFHVRGPEPKNPKRKTRILCLGDSITYGFRLKPHQAFPAKLENELEERYEVINAGVPGYSILQGSRFYRKYLEELEPDLVILQFGYNDAYEAYNADSDQPFVPNFIFWMNRKLSSLRLYGGLANKVFRLKDELRTLRVPQEEFEEIYHDLEKEVKKKKGKVVFLVTPKYDPDRNAILFPPRYPPDGALLIDLRKIFKEEIPKEQWNGCFIDLIHPSAKGAEIYAREIGKELKKRNLVK